MIGSILVERPQRGIKFLADTLGRPSGVREKGARPSRRRCRPLAVQPREDPLAGGERRCWPLTRRRRGDGSPTGIPLPAAATARARRRHCGRVQRQTPTVVRAACALRLLPHRGHVGVRFDDGQTSRNPRSRTGPRIPLASPFAKFSSVTGPIPPCPAVPSAGATTNSEARSRRLRVSAGR